MTASRTILIEPNRLFRQGLKHRLTDGFHELVILRLGHPRRGRVGLRLVLGLSLGLSQNEAEA